MDYQNDLKFSQDHPVGKSNVFWKFGENLSTWRHYDVIGHFCGYYQEIYLEKCRQNHDNSVNEIYNDKGTHELSFDGSTNFSQQKLGKLYSVSYGSLKLLIFDDVIMKSDDVITKIKKIIYNFAPRRTYYQIAKFG